jgi:Tfp pilus assembly protein PilO
MEETVSNLPLWLQFLGPILVALLTSIAGWMGLKKQLQKDTATAKKEEAEAAQAIQEAAIALLKPYKDKVDLLTEKVHVLDCAILDLTKERDDLKDRVLVLETGVDKLVEQLRDAGIDPVWERNGE